MADSESKGFNIPWAQLFALAAVIAGLTALLPSPTARPPAGVMEQAVHGQEGISARLWQDPLQVVSEALERDRKERSGSTATKPCQLRDEYIAETKRLPASKPPLVLIACVPDSPYAEDVERRLRDRSALLQAFTSYGLAPKKSTSLRYLITKSQHSLPFEWFVRYPQPEAEGTGQRQAADECRWSSVLVFWAGDCVFGEKPLANFASILKELTPEGQAVETCVLGPRSSGQYHTMLVEAGQAISNETKQLLSKTRIYSCKASAEEEVFRTVNKWVEPKQSTADAVMRKFEAPGSAFLLQRTVPTDGDLCAALWEELKQRKVGADATIVVLAELDSFYGQALPDTFFRANPNANRENIHIYSYPAGIDGALPRNALGIEEKVAKDDSKSGKPAASFQESPEGQSQVDYFRRLAEALAQKNKELCATSATRPFGTRQDIRAVVVLGADTYDKLQILRTLRPRLPDALFLTNQLDARYGHSDEWNETRNLLVAAAYSLTSTSVRTGIIPMPFRDSQQGAVYTAARMALGETCFKPEKVRMFEIGKAGPVELGLPTTSRYSIGWLLAALAVAIILAALMQHGSANKPDADKPDADKNAAAKPENAAPRTPGALRNFFAAVPRWLASSRYSVPFFLLLSASYTLYRFRTQNDSTAEPFAWYHGISIWPGDFVRLFTLLLGLHFMRKILFRLKESSGELADQYGLPKQAKPTTGWLAFWPGSTHPDPKNIAIDDIASRHLTWGTDGKRISRAFILFVLYFAFIFFVLSAFRVSSPSLPVRGEAGAGSFAILIAAIVSTLIVTFLIVDATRMHCFFIRDVKGGRSQWNLDHIRQDKHLGPMIAALEDEDANDFIDIQYIAQRSDVVNHLVYYPFILITLMILARLTSTDGYPWPGMLIAIFAVNLSWVCYCAIRLPREAKKARSESLDRLRAKLVGQRAREANSGQKPRFSNSVALEDAIKQIEELRKGAFVGVWEQPLLGALLVPSGGVGLWTLFDLLQK